MLASISFATALRCLGRTACRRLTGGLMFGGGGLAGCRPNRLGSGTAVLGMTCATKYLRVASNVRNLVVHLPPSREVLLAVGVVAGKGGFILRLGHGSRRSHRVG